MIADTVYLLYHELNVPGRPLSRDFSGHLRYAVLQSQFAAQLSHLKDQRLGAMSVSEALAERDPAVQAVCITFDDGAETDLTCAAPMLKEFGFSATFYVPVGWLGRPGYMSAGQLRELAALGFEIGCHSMSHRYLTSLGDSDMLIEVAQSKVRLEQILGSRVDHFSCPGGFWDLRVARAAKLAGYVSVATSRIGVNKAGADRDRLARVTIMKGTTLSEFARLCRGKDLWWKQAKGTALSLPKTLLGADNYVWVRSFGAPPKIPVVPQPNGDSDLLSEPPIAKLKSSPKKPEQWSSVRRATGGASKIEFREGRGVLIINQQGLGDLVETIPLMKAVCRWANGRWPVRVLLDSKPYFELIQEEKLDIIPYYLRPNYQGKKGLFLFCRDMMGTTDLIICPPELSASKLAFLRIAIRARHAAGEAEAPLDRLHSFSVRRDWSKSFLQTQDELAEELGLPVPLESPSLRVTPREAAWAGSLLRAAHVNEGDLVVGIHASSTVAQKRWPAENFGEALKRLGTLFPDLAVVSFGVAEERADADKSREVAGSVNWIDGVGRWKIRETLAMLGQCDLFLSGDTGLMHMAAAVGTRTLSIFGPTSPARRGPTYNGGLFAAPDTNCHPCFKGRWKECACIRLVDVDRVVASARQLLNCAQENKRDREFAGHPLAH